MKVRYPLEAFALAMVVFSQNMRDALITGILILLITTLGLVLDRLFGGKIPKWSRNSCNIILMVALTYSLFQIILITVLGYDLEDTAYIFHIFIGILIAKHVIDAEGNTDYNHLMLEGAGAFATLLIIAIIREFMSEGSIYGYEIADFRQISIGFSQAIMGFLLTGIGIAVLNSIYYKNAETNIKRTESLFVIVPVVLVIQPFTIDSIDPSASMAITILMVLFLLYSVRRYLVFSKLSKDIKHMPVELLSTGIIYMILSMF